MQLCTGVSYSIHSAFIKKRANILMWCQRLQLASKLYFKGWGNRLPSLWWHFTDWVTVLSVAEINSSVFKLKKNHLTIVHMCILNKRPPVSLLRPRRTKISEKTVFTVYMVFPIWTCTSLPWTEGKVLAGFGRLIKKALKQVRERETCKAVSGCEHC